MTGHVESIEDRQEGVGARFFRFKITGVGRDSLKKVLTCLLTCSIINTMGASKITERYC